MRKGLLYIVVLSVLAFSLAGISYGWQGRMGGMGDPYGLVSDESDFLIHPSKIAKGEGIRFYGDYRFTYTGVTNLDWNLDYLLTGDWDDVDTSGDELRHNVLVGAAFPLGPGRMGVFFTYEGMRGNYGGDWFTSQTGPPPFWTIDELRSDLDAFALSLFYGLPVGGLNLGGEVQFAYRGEEQTNYVYQNDLTDAFSNDELFAGFFGFFPYDSEYWETLLKGSLEGAIGPADVAFTLRGGFIFAGDNGWELENQSPVGTPVSGWDLDGGVDGWRIGGDLWLRYPMTESLTLPFLVRVDYQAKTRDGDGGGTYAWTGDQVDYENQEQSFALEVGGGLDKELNAGTRVAGGLYYNYLQRNNTFSWYDAWATAPDFDTEDLIIPDLNEHQILLRLAGEHEVSPSVALRAGLNLFYGWVQWKGDYYYYRLLRGIVTQRDADISMNGHHWGIGASLGGTVRFNGFALEPFVNAGYQQLSLDGDGDWYTNGVLTNLLEGESARSEWYIGGGCSFLFDMP
jgi:hypothetical protein